MFGGIALLLAAVGVYGVLSYAVAQRRAEVGIRMALGADGRAVRSMVLNDGLRLVSENPNRVDPLPLSELVIQGLGHTLVRRIKLMS